MALYKFVFNIQFSIGSRIPTSVSPKMFSSQADRRAGEGEDRRRPNSVPPKSVPINISPFFTAQFYFFGLHKLVELHA